MAYLIFLRLQSKHDRDFKQQRHNYELEALQGNNYNCCCTLCQGFNATTVIPYAASARSGIVHGTPLHFSVCKDFLQSAFYRFALAATFVLVHTFWTLCALSAFEGLPLCLCKQNWLSEEKSSKQRWKKKTVVFMFSYHRQLLYLVYVQVLWRKPYEFFATVDC